jgi:hypothetical protein
MRNADKCVAWWLNQGFSGPGGDINECSGNGWAPMPSGLLWGGGGAAKTAKLFIDRGASMEIQPTGHTNLNPAMFGWDTEALEMLLKVGGQQMIDQIHGKVIPANAFFRRIMWLFRLIYYSGDKRLWMYIVASTKGNTSLHAAVLGGEYSMVKITLRHQPDLHAR